MNNTEKPKIRMLNTHETAEEREANFRRSVSRIVVEKYEGDVFAYIKNLVDTIDTLEANLENMTNAFLVEGAA